MTPTLVENVTVDVAEPFAGGVNGFWVNEQVVSPGSEEQARTTGDENPETDVTVTVADTVPGLFTVAAVGVAEIVKSGPAAAPVPDSATV